MHCLFLFRDSKGRLPTARDLSRCGFCVSKAALPALQVCEECMVSANALPRGRLALAAQPKAAYGGEPLAGKREADACRGDDGV